MIVYTCPECGHDLRELVVATCPPIHRKECPNCHWSLESTPEPVQRIPFQPIPHDTIPVFNEFVPIISPACQHCSNNPANGGSGICHCILGNNVIYCGSADNKTVDTSYLREMYPYTPEQEIEDKGEYAHHISQFSGVTIHITPAEGPKCPRCWNHDENIGKPGHHPELCDRCARVLKEEGYDIN